MFIHRCDRTTHGATGTLTHRRWLAMLARCEWRADSPYQAKGIQVCERWKSFENFIDDMGECPSDAMTLDRINNKLGYEPGNCRWATRTTQARNTTRNRLLSFNGETHCVADWADITGLRPQTILNRLRYGWSIERTLSEAGDGRAKRQPRTSTGA